jgi:mRNA-degrading endonuclease YafQ of YafQ-DinJ toxin-antitoxin module
MEIEFSPKFKKAFDKLPLEERKAAVNKIEILRINPFDPVLKTHKLHGLLKKYFALSVNYKKRIIFSIESGRTIRLHTVGNHNIY